MIIQYYINLNCKVIEINYDEMQISDFCFSRPNHDRVLAILGLTSKKKVSRRLLAGCFVIIIATCIDNILIDQCSIAGRS